MGKFDKKTQFERDHMLTNSAVNDRLSRLRRYLNENTISYIEKVISIQYSPFEVERYFEEFCNSESSIIIANYCIYHRTKKFFNEFTRENKKNIIEFQYGTNIFSVYLVYNCVRILLISIQFPNSIDAQKSEKIIVTISKISDSLIREIAQITKEINTLKYPQGDNKFTSIAKDENIRIEYLSSRLDELKCVNKEMVNIINEIYARYVTFLGIDEERIEPNPRAIMKSKNKYEKNYLWCSVQSLWITEMDFVKEEVITL